MTQCKVNSHRAESRELRAEVAVFASFICAHAFGVGGAEEMVLNLVRSLPSASSATVCCIHEAGVIGEEIRRPAHGRFSRPHARPWRPFDVGPPSYLRRVQPDIVHTFLLTASLYGRLAAILRASIVIGTEVNIYERKHRHHAIAERLLMAARIA